MNVWTYEDAKARSEADERTLGEAFLAQVKRSPRGRAVIDARSEMSRLKLAAVALALEPLLDLEPDEKRVGVVLPPGVGGTLVNVALTLSGRTPVNLNHTTGEAQLGRMARLAGLKTVISSSLYLSKIGEPTLPGRVVHAEDLIPKVDKLKVLWQMLRVLLLPASRVDRSKTDDLATVVFSSGSTGDPKGVQITHRQMIFNCDAVKRHVDLHEDVDVLASPLPLFHSFGLIVGTWMGLVHGIVLAQQADPRDGRALGKLMERAGATILVSTPTFVRGYMRRIEPEQLEKLRFGVVGAERCPIALHEAFRERYGVPLLEGYGCTELAPAASVKTPDFIKEGSVGRPLPGVEVFTMDPETREPLGAGEEGLLVVRTPALMEGYLDRPDLTEKVMIHGGYDTGDIGHVDEDGFIHLTGRLARFAKIAGEMVPLDNVEAAMQAWLVENYEGEFELAVGAVPSARRGERLIVLHEGLPCEPAELLEGLADLPALFKPKPLDFHPVDAIPLLGTGKRDLAKIREMAAAVAGGEAGSG